jgi:hypothetical protein
MSTQNGDGDAVDHPAAPAPGRTLMVWGMIVVPLVAALIGLVAALIAVVPRPPSPPTPTGANANATGPIQASATVTPAVTTPALPSPTTASVPRTTQARPAATPVTWRFNVTSVPHCSHIRGRGVRPTGHAVIFVQQQDHARYYWERPIKFDGTNWVAEYVTVGGNEAVGVEFTLHAVAVDDAVFNELNEHNGTEYFLPNQTLPWPVGTPLGSKTVIRTDGPSVC